MTLGRLDHVYYWTADMSRAVAFYRDVLGLPLARRDGDDWAEFDAGGSRFALHGAVEGHPVRHGGVRGRGPRRGQATARGPRRAVPRAGWRGPGLREVRLVLGPGREHGPADRVFLIAPPSPSGRKSEGRPEGRPSLCARVLLAHRRT